MARRGRAAQGRSALLLPSRSDNAGVPHAPAGEVLRGLPLSLRVLRMFRAGSLFRALEGCTQAGSDALPHRRGRHGLHAFRPSRALRSSPSARFPTPRAFRPFPHHKKKGGISPPLFSSSSDRRTGGEARCRPAAGRRSLPPEACRFRKAARSLPPPRPENALPRTAPARRARLLCPAGQGLPAARKARLLPRREGRALPHGAGPAEGKSSRPPRPGKTAGWEAFPASFPAREPREARAAPCPAERLPAALPRVPALPPASSLPFGARLFPGGLPRRAFRTPRLLFLQLLPAVAHVVEVLLLVEVVTRPGKLVPQVVETAPALGLFLLQRQFLFIAFLPAPRLFHTAQRRERVGSGAAHKVTQAPPPVVVGQKRKPRHKRGRGGIGLDGVPGRVSVPFLPFLPGKGGYVSFKHESSLTPGRAALPARPEPGGVMQHFPAPVRALPRPKKLLAFFAGRLPARRRTIPYSRPSSPPASAPIPAPTGPPSAEPAASP